jgi:putative hydroxymethylpyrimidine transport system substrate-binding protein
MIMTAKRALGVALLAAATLASVPAQAADKVKLLLDWFVNPDHAAPIVAQQRGIFTKHGLEVELVVPADPNAPPRLVAAGQADFAISYQPQLQMLVAEGLPLARVGVLVAQPLNSLVSLESGPVKGIADLKGRKIGYSVAGFEEAILGAMLQSAGLTLKEVTLINVNFNLTTALLSKQVDAVIGAFRNFELNDLEIHNQRGRVFLVEQHGVPVYDELVIVAKRDAVNTDRTRRLLAALREATDWLLANPQEGWETFARHGKEVANELNKRAWKDTLPLLARDPAAVDIARYDTFGAFLKERGLLKTVVPPRDYIREIR